MPFSFLAPPFRAGREWEIIIHSGVLPYGVLDPDWYSVKAVVAETGYSASHLRYLIKQEKVTAQKIRGKWLLSRHSMNEYISRKKKKNGA